MVGISLKILLLSAFFVLAANGQQTALIVEGQDYALEDHQPGIDKFPDSTKFSDANSETFISRNEIVSLPEFSRTVLDEGNPGAFIRADGERVGFSGFAGEYSGKVTGGYGSYDSPFIDARFGKGFETSDILFKGGYRSTQGHVLNADSRRGYASLGGSSQLPDDFGMVAGAGVKGSMGLMGDSYRLFGSTIPTLERTINRFRMDVSMSSNFEDIFAYTSAAHIYRSVLTDMNRSAETSLGFEMTGTRQVNSFELKGDAGVWGNFYSSPSAQHNPHFAQFGFSARHRLFDQVDVVGGLTLYLPGGSDVGIVGRLYPKLSVSWNANNWLMVFARFEPYVQRTTLSGFIDESPYLVNDIHLRHAEYFTNFSLGAEGDVTNSVRARISLNYKDSQNYPLYVEANSTRMWEVEYFGQTRILALEGEVDAGITESSSLGASLTIRGSKNSVTGQGVPYLPSFVAGASYRHRLPFGLVVGTNLKVIGKRYIDLDNSRSIKPFTLLGCSAEYDIIPQLKGILTLNNILRQNQIWWDNYPGQLTSASLALSYAW